MFDSLDSELERSWPDGCRQPLDAGASAKSSGRPELMRMIQYVKANKVAYCIIHKVDRLARNRADDVSIHLALQQCGVLFVSTSEKGRRDPLRDAAARHHVHHR